MTEKTSVESTNTEKPNTKSSVLMGSVSYIIAVGVLVAYGFFIHFLLGEVGNEEPEWSRSIYLFTGVEAIVFAAAGFLFGKEVNRKRAENAEEEKKVAEKQREEAKEKEVEERKNALILGAMAIQAEKTAAGIPDQSSALEGMTAVPTSTSLGSIAEKARKMYPELND